MPYVHDMLWSRVLAEVEDSGGSEVDRNPFDILSNCQSKCAVSTVSFGRTLVSSGKHPNTCALCTMEGNHSWEFHAPSGPPHTWPSRTSRGTKGVCAAALNRISSETHFDSA